MRAKVLFICLLNACLMLAQESGEPEKKKVYQGFSGGMMLHTGYMFGRDGHAPHTADGRSCSPQGAVFGIGGAVQVYLWQHLRTGVEGFVSSMPSWATDCNDVLRNGSYVRMGYGGVLADCCWRLDKVWPYIGGTIGGGAMKGLYILEGDQYSWTQDANSTFHKQSFFYVTPYVGCDYCLTDKVHLSFRLDWMLAFHKSELCMPTGPRLFIGFMFCH